MKRIKILQVVPSLSRVNGVASYAMNYYRNISNIDMDFVVANLDTKSDYFEEINANGNKIYNLSKNLSTSSNLNPKLSCKKSFDLFLFHNKV